MFLTLLSYNLVPKRLLEGLVIHKSFISLAKNNDSDYVLGTRVIKPKRLIKLHSTDLTTTITQSFPHFCKCFNF